MGPVKTVVSDRKCLEGPWILAPAAASLVLRDREGGQVLLSVDGCISLLYQNSSQAPMPLPQALRHLYISLRLFPMLHCMELAVCMSSPSSL